MNYYGMTKLFLNIKQLCVFGCFCLISFNSVANNAYQSHEKIHHAVKQFLDKTLEAADDIELNVIIDKIDPRLKLKKCDQTLKTFTAASTAFNSRFSVGVICDGKQEWSLYVPVQIQRIASFYVASRPISRGHSISENDIQLVKKDLNHVRGRYIKEHKKLLGMIAKRRIQMGKTFNPKYLRPPIVVKKGDAVDIIALTQSLEIRMSGKAITAGAKGDRIQVRNSSSKRLIEATVLHSGLVEIKL